MRRRNFIKGLLGLVAVPVVAKAGIGAGSCGNAPSEIKVQFDGGLTRDHVSKFVEELNASIKHARVDKISALEKGDVITFGSI